LQERELRVIRRSRAHATNQAPQPRKGASNKITAKRFARLLQPDASGIAFQGRRRLR
jgi:hypothetical protein